MKPDFLTLPDRRLAYQRLNGVNTGIIFLGGYASDMTGTKASFLAERCAAAKRPFLRFDYRGHGQSDGVFAQCTLGDWLADSVAMFDQLTAGPQILVGSSMGGWLALMLAAQRPARVAALIGIAAAPDFTEDLIWDRLTPAQREQLERDGSISDGGAPVGLAFIKEARKHLLLRAPLPVICPVRLLQGMKDNEVPWQHAQRIADRLPHKDVHVELIKDGDHRLSRPEDLKRLWQTVEEFE